MVVLVLVATRAYYDTFGLLGRWLANAVVLGGVLALGSLALMISRLYIRPVLVNGKERIVGGRSRGRRNA